MDWKKIDPYFGAGIGISNSKYKNLDAHTIINTDALNKSVPGNLDFTGQLGLKYFPTKHFGFYTEIGYVHGALLHVGFTGKF